MSISSFNELRDKALSSAPVMIAIAAAEDSEVILSAINARRQGLIRGAVLTGNQQRIQSLLSSLANDCEGLQVCHADGPAEAAALAVAAVRSGKADILVKGALDSSLYFRAVLDKSRGLRRSQLLSSVTLFELPSYHKLLAVTDNAMTLLPDLQQKQIIIDNTRSLFDALEITRPRVALVAAVEKENPQMSATTDAVQLRELNRRGEMGSFLVDGPFGYDACISRRSAVRKGLENSEVAGYPDLLLMPSLEAANILGKAYKYHANADSGGLILGASAPVVINSRSDDARRRLNSLLLAKAMIACGRTEASPALSINH